MDNLEVKLLSNFERLASINVNEQIEKKGGLSYLSWAWAVDRLLRADPAAVWEYGEDRVFDDGTMMVRCTVTAFDKPMSMHLPVMDHRNNPISKPDAFQVNTAMQRCLVKAIALHGLGLYIYAGEDLPPGEEAPEPEPEKPAKRPNTARQVAVDALEAMSPEEQTFLRDSAMEIIAMHEQGADIKAALGAMKLDNEEKLALWSLLPAPVRSALKRAPTPGELGTQG